MSLGRNDETHSPRSPPAKDTQAGFDAGLKDEAILGYLQPFTYG
jgi:hypothetical protein